MLNTFTFSLPEPLRNDFNAATASWSDKTTRIWEKDASVWTGDDESKWLGWLSIAERELADVNQYVAFQKDIGKACFSHTLLMGMGGSSLCPEVLALTFGRQNFHILDSTDPSQIKSLEGKLDLEETLFIVASKSGSTLEPNCFKQYFFERLSESVGRENAGKQFVAITDPGSKMEQVAKADGFRHIFYGDPEVGGRFSALSPFGIAAAASMGLDVEQFLRTSGEMVSACRDPTPQENPGTQLGILLGICQRAGRDKLTVFAADEIHDLGAWLEQLVAESTGKKGVAIIPVDREPAQSAASYGEDRVFAFLSLRGDERYSEFASQLTDAGHPVVQISLDSIDNLGQEFFRWEFATAVAGSIMGINPFDQPDVEAAKIETRKLTDEYEQKGSLPSEEPFFRGDGVSLFSTDEYAKTLQRSLDEDSLEGLLRAHIAQIGTSDYFALLAYVEMNAENERLLQTIREKVLQTTGAATCLGFGPRFLHSTGQAYKGGGNNGVFLQITADDASDLPVPGQKYTFGVVKAAQARGDFQVLLDRGRRALRVHLGTDVKAGLEKLGSIS